MAPSYSNSLPTSLTLVMVQVAFKPSAVLQIILRILISMNKLFAFKMCMRLLSGKFELKPRIPIHVTSVYTISIVFYLGSSQCSHLLCCPIKHPLKGLLFTVFSTFSFKAIWLVSLPPSKQTNKPSILHSL